MKVVKADLLNAGGNCKVIWGQLDNDKYFVFERETFSFLDADYGETLTDEFFERTSGDTSEWDKAHVIKSYYGSYTDEINSIINQSYVQLGIEKQIVKFKYMKEIEFDVEVANNVLDRIPLEGTPEWIDNEANLYDDEQPLEFVGFKRIK